jgi:hypothetical protein
MKNRIEISWIRETVDGGKELQLRATYNEERDEWRIEKRMRRSDDYSYCDTTRNVWRCFEEQAQISF